MTRPMTTEELSEFLQVPLTTIYKWRAEGNGPPAFRIGKYLRFDRSEVEAWMETRRDARVPR